MDEIPLWALIFGVPVLYTTWYMVETRARRMRNNAIRKSV